MFQSAFLMSTCENDVFIYLAYNKAVYRVRGSFTDAVDPELDHPSSARSTTSFT